MVLPVPHKEYGIHRYLFWMLGVLEQAVLAEINAARTSPTAYASKIEALRQYYDGLMLRIPGKPVVLTVEGEAALADAISILKRITPVKAITKISAGMCHAACDHASDLGTTGHVAHQGTDGTTPSDRLNRCNARI